MENKENKNVMSEKYTEVFKQNIAQFDELNMVKSRAGRTAHEKSEDMVSDRQVDHIDNKVFTEKA